jgi:hypothetical protein
LAWQNEVSCLISVNKIKFPQKTQTWYSTIAETRVNLSRVISLKWPIIFLMTGYKCCHFVLVNSLDIVKHCQNK